MSRKCALSVLMLLALVLPAAAGGPNNAVVADSDGVVTYTGRYFRHGTMVELRRNDGMIRRYTHLSRIAPGVTPGVRLRAGQILGESAADGSAAPF